jgi:ATP-dependent protease ClpP protease subunit
MSKQLTVRMKGDDTAEVLLYDVIGADMFGGIDAKTFRAQIKAVKAKAIELRINSPGGSVTEAAAMLQALDEFPGRIDVTVDGLAASAATVVMMAGDSIVAARNALLMIHNPWAGVMGTAADMRRVADLLDKIRGQILDTYAGRPGMKLSREELSRRHGRRDVVHGPGGGGGRAHRRRHGARQRRGLRRPGQRLRRPRLPAHAGGAGKLSPGGTPRTRRHREATATRSFACVAALTRED